MDVLQAGGMVVINMEKVRFATLHGAASAVKAKQKLAAVMAQGGILPKQCAKLQEGTGSIIRPVHTSASSPTMLKQAPLGIQRVLLVGKCCQRHWLSWPVLP